MNPPCRLLILAVLMVFSGGCQAAPKIVVSPGYVAVRVPADLDATVGGLLEPGCHADLVGTFRLDPEQPDALSAITILQNITVLAISGDTRTGGVTVMIQEGQSEYLILAVEIVRTQNTRLLRVAFSG